MNAKFTVEKYTAWSLRPPTMFIYYQFHVIINKTRDELYVFYGEEYYDGKKITKRDVTDVKISEDEKEIITMIKGKKPVSHPLPIAVRYIEGGHKIELTWPDGKKEERYRMCTTNPSYMGQDLEKLLNFPDSYFGPPSSKEEKIKNKKSR